MPKRKTAEDPYFAPGEEQGQLARPAFWMQSSERYPRGYTPERLREVTEAFKGTKQLSGHPEEVAQMTEAVARSTVPVEHIRDLDIVRAGSAEGLKPGMEADDVHFSAKYTESAPFRMKDGEEKQLPVSRLHVEQRVGVNRNRRERALIHAIGHHVQNLLVLGKRQSMWDAGASPSDAAQEIHTSPQWDATTLAAKEADAEDYADKHFRDDPRGEPAGPSVWDSRAMDANRQRDPGNARVWSNAYALRRNLSRQFREIGS